jgi:hypothetical protein
MRDELSTIYQAIQESQLPARFEDLLASVWDQEQSRFHTQETYILDFKETLPEKLSDGYGAGIIRLILAFHNTYGGLIIFGVRDRIFTVQGVAHPVDVESINRMLSDFSTTNIECIAKQYTIQFEGGSKSIAALLVPRRGITAPVKLTKDLASYSAGTLWVRDRHEVVEAGVKHLPIVFGDRLTYPSLESSTEAFPIHRSLPPSPSTVKEFVNRGDLLQTLWSWFVLGDQPRLYLHGPGGSGKSTIAFQFAHALADNGASVRGITGDRLDYVIYISAKETELNVLTQRQQPFALRQFETADQQFGQILYHSGFLDEKEIGKSTPKQVEEKLKELMNHFCGLIVVDDIDTLSRKSIDTGEEVLFMDAVLASKRTRVLYTVRFPPANALNTAFKVQGLEPDKEFPEFLNACCKQFETAYPPTKQVGEILIETSGLPLLVEAVVGLRKYSSNYSEALSSFKERGGDDARRYLYQREYDRLEPAGKARQVLAALLLVEEPISFSMIADFFQFPRDQVGSALSETSNIFLSTYDGASGETLYQLSPPAIPFVRQVSKNLSYFNQLSVRVGHFRQQGLTNNPEDAVTIVAMDAYIRNGKLEALVALGEKLPKGSPVLMNPRVRSLMGQAYSELGPNYRERARECFKHAEGLGFIDTFMMRRWFNMEMQSGYGLQEAERICNKVITSDKIGPRYKSEFWSKLGQCHFSRANSVVGVNKEKGLDHLQDSIICYMEALWVGRDAAGVDKDTVMAWLERPLIRYVSGLSKEFEKLFTLLEKLVERNHDVHEAGVSSILSQFSKSRIPADPKTLGRIRGRCNRTCETIKRKLRPIDAYPGFNLVLSVLEAIRNG